MRFTAVALALFASGAVSLTGCAVEDDSDTAEAPELGEGGDDGGGKADDPTMPQLRQRYALEIVSNTRLRDTRNGNVSDIQLKARAQVATAQSGGNIAMGVKLCDVKLPRVGDYQPRFAVADFVARIPQLDVFGDITKDSETGTYTLVTDPVALVLGAQLTTPLTEALPTDKNDSRVRDSDGDGKKGVSLLIPGIVKIYGVLRLNLSLDAPIAAATSGALSGTAEVEVAQEVLDDDNLLIDVKKMVAEQEPYTEVVSTINTFRMRGDVATCDAVRTTYPWP